jgi:hypothetical protein
MSFQRGGSVKAILFIISAFSVQVFGQDYRQAMDLDRYREPARKETTISLLANDPFIEKMSRQITREMELKYQDLMSGLSLAAQDCSDPAQTLRKIRALRINGDFDSCMSLAKTCRTATSSEAQRTLVEGAACAYQVVKLKETFELFDLATAPQFENSETQDLSVYRFILFARNSQFEAQVPDILARYSKWNAQEVKEILGILTLINEGHSQDFSEGQLQQKMLALANKNPDWANEMTIAWLTHLVVNKYDRVGGLKFLDKGFQKIYEVDRAYKYVFQAFFIRREKTLSSASPRWILIINIQLRFPGTRLSKIFIPSPKFTETIAASR